MYLNFTQDKLSVYEIRKHDIELGLESIEDTELSQSGASGGVMVSKLD